MVVIMIGGKGAYQNETGQTSCKPCGAGKYGDTIWSNCRKCM